MKKYRISGKSGMRFLKNIRMLSLLMLFSFTIMSVYSKHECQQWKTSVVTLKNKEILHGFVAVKNGLVLPLRGEATLDIIGKIDKKFDFNNGTAVLAGDITLGSAIKLRNSGSISGNGYVVSLSGDIRVNDSISFISDTIIDGHGSSIIFEGDGNLVINDNVQLTLKNLQINDLMTKKIIFVGSNSTLKIQNSTLNLCSDMTFDQGKFIVSGNVDISGPYKFSLNSLQPTRICKHSVLTINPEVVLQYNPGGNVLHDVRSLMQMEDKTSTLYCNGCTLDIPSNGLQLTKGRLIFENKVLINNYGNEDSSKGFVWGDGTIANDLHVLLNAGARLEVDGCIHATT